jgi:hypothetical protein
MMNPQIAPRIATGKAARYASDMSGLVWLVARSTSRTMHRNATDRKKVITPVTRPIPALRKNLFIIKTVAAIDQPYVKIIS